MPRKKGLSSSKILIGVILIAIATIAIIGWHDGLNGVTPMVILMILP